MIISIIAAFGRNNVIGNNGEIPWDLPKDLARFRKITMGKPVIMGRVTFESIGKPLSGRVNIVLTRDPLFKAKGVLIAGSIDEALEIAGDAEEVMVIGGAGIYKHFLPLANHMYLTLLDEEYDGDTFFPQYELDEWGELSREIHKPTTKNPFSFTFVHLKRY